MLFLRDMHCRAAASRQAREQANVARNQRSKAAAKKKAAAAASKMAATQAAGAGLSVSLADATEELFGADEGSATTDQEGKQTLSAMLTDLTAELF